MLILDSVSFLVFAIGNSEQMGKHVYNADLQTQVTYHPQDTKKVLVQ